MSKNSKYVTSNEACIALNITRAELWNYAGRGLSQPLLISPRRAMWLSAEVMTLKPKIEARRAILAA
jgi:hypothetical protein